MFTDDRQAALHALASSQKNRLLFWSAVALCLGISHAVLAWSPGTGSPTATQGFVVDPTNRMDVLSFYNTITNATANEASDMAWTGSVASGIAGTTSGTFKNDVLRKINFYRALVQLPGDIGFDATDSSGDQNAALMFSANNQLSHTPPSSWTDFTVSGSNAASHSNIALGTYGADSVDAYIRDDGSNNIVVGHRRWLLYPAQQTMGTGDIPSNGSFASANAIWVFATFKPTPPAQFVPWPNSGYSPISLTPARWSLSYPGANFGAATVTMTQGATSIPVTIISNNSNGYGDNSIVWTPTGIPSVINSDTTYQVTVSGITGAGVPTSNSYTVTLFDPGVLGNSVTITGPSIPYKDGTGYTFNSIAQADSYELRVAQGSSAPWAEGAEDSPAPQITQLTSGSYPLRQSSVVHSGAKAFQLAFPDFTDQSFQIIRDVIPSAASQLQFYDLGRFATTTTTLSAEISTDNGNTWTGVFSRNGVGLSSNLWDSTFNSRSVSLAAYAGKIIHIRFIMRTNGGSAVIDTSANSGFFIDDVTVTNSTLLTGTTVTTLPTNATTFTLNSATAGGPLTIGATYYMRIRPNVGTRWFGDGSLKIVTPQTNYSAWITQYPQVTGGINTSFTNDGISNGTKYAFGLNPTIASPASAIPTPTQTGSNYAVTFTPPANISGVTYGAQWSVNLVNWTAIPDTGTGGKHTFSVSTVGQSRMFFRYQTVITP